MTVPHSDLTTTIKRYADLLLEPHVTAADVGKHLGREHGSPDADIHRFEPQDPRFSEIQLYLDEDFSGKRAPYSLKLTLAASTALHIPEITHAFGPWHPGTPTPEGSPFVIVFRYHAPHTPHHARLNVALTGAAQDPQARAATITIVRQEAL